MSITDRLLGRLRPPARVERVSFPAIRYAPGVMNIPVLVIRYLPAIEGRVAREFTGDVEGPLDGIREHVEQTQRRVIEALETGSMYHGYRDPNATASLRYEVVGSLEYLEPLPTWNKPGHRVPMTDYRAILDRAGIEAWVERGVKEVWVWGYHGGVVDLWESNMSGPFGDISNSDRDPGDLPGFGKTYTVYHYNYGRGTSEAVENHMHQIEAVLRHADEEMFWHRFVGRPGEGRCGWSHVPPNGERDYDWANRRFRATDIEDWDPEGGPRKRLNCERWGGDSLTWFIYWMQNLPGGGNGLRYRERALSNWWRFVGEWDGAMREGLGLVESDARGRRPDI